MKKVIFGLLVACFFAGTASAQIPTFTQSDNLAGISIGFGGLYTGSGYTSKSPAISLYYEHCVVDNLWDSKSSLGIGGMLGFASAKWERPGGGGGYNHSNFFIGGRGTLHYAFVDKLDTYAGLMTGYNNVSDKQFGNTAGIPSTVPGGFCWSLFAGARYYFTESFAAFAELNLGYYLPVMSLGISLKF